MVIPLSIGGGERSQVHQLAKLFYLAAAHRHLEVEILQTQNIRVVKPGLDLADLVQIDAKRTVAAEEVRRR